MGWLECCLVPPSFLPGGGAKPLLTSLLKILYIIALNDLAHVHTVRPVSNTVLERIKEKGERGRGRGREGSAPSFYLP